jgi:hypothetical protein
MKKVFSINVPGKHGYSFAVKCDTSYDEESVIELAAENRLFDEDEDADYAIAEDITESDYDIQAFKDTTYEL